MPVPIPTTAGQPGWAKCEVCGFLFEYVSAEAGQAPAICPECPTPAVFWLLGPDEQQRHLEKRRQAELRQVRVVQRQYPLDSAVPSEEPRGCPFCDQPGQLKRRYQVRPGKCSIGWNAPVAELGEGPPTT